jgi:hypothetical protein
MYVERDHLKVFVNVLIQLNMLKKDSCTAK